MQLLHLLLAERIVLFYSPSGAGKTSLIQAALIPKLEEEGFHVLPSMRVSLGPSTDEQVDSVSNRYVFSLLLSLEEALPPEQRMPLSELSALTLGEYLDRRQDGDEAVGTVLIFDQFEEILTLDPIDRELKLEFFAQVGAALRDRRRWALFAMREEFIAGLEDPYLRPIPTRLRTYYRLGLLAPQYARQAIQEPAKAAGVTFTDAAADKLVADLSTVRLLQPDGSLEERPGPYVEPVQLQVVCRRLWDLLPGGTSQIVEEDIGLLADVDLALSGYYADQVKATASKTRVGERTIRNWFDHQLITEQGIRGQVLEGPKESEGLDNRAIWPLVNAHLVRAEKRRGATWLELAHDRLIEPVQASNAAWRRARLIRWIAVGTTLIGILTIALALFVGMKSGQAAANAADLTAAAAKGTAVAAEGTAVAAEGTAIAAEETAAAANSTVIAAEATAQEERDAAQGTAIAAQRTATAAKGTATAAQSEAAAAEGTAIAAQNEAEQARNTAAAAQETVASLETQVAGCAVITPTTPHLPQTLTWTPTPTPTLPQPPTSPPTQPPTPAVTRAPLCSVEAQGRFAGLWQRYRPRLGCPLYATPMPIEDAEQAFENGRMFWREDDKHVYVVYEQGTRKDTYQTFDGPSQSDTPACSYPCEASPPEGFYSPVPGSGFRVAWCRLCAEDAPIGWGLAGEVGFGPGNGDPLVQEFEGGLIFRDSKGKADGKVYIFFDDGKFVRVPY
jgi:hypothetical protein